MEHYEDGNIDCYTLKIPPTGRNRAINIIMGKAGMEALNKAMEDAIKNQLKDYEKDSPQEGK